VSVLSGRLSWDEIVQLIHNPTTGRPISKSTLSKAFKAELASGTAALKAKIMEGFHAALDERQAWAVAFGLRAIIGMRDGERVPQLQLEVPGEKNRPSIQVTFVAPDRNDPRFRDDDVIEHQPVQYDANPPGTKLLPAPNPTSRPMANLTGKRGHWMD
jgi:hypothetical protein